MNAALQNFAPAFVSPKVTRHAVTLVAALLLASASPRAFAQVRVAVVDLQRALAQTEDGRKAKARLKRLLKRRQRSLNKQQEEIKALKEEIETNLEIWNEATKQKKVQSYQEQLLKLQEQYVEYQREVAETEARLTREIIGRMERIIRRIGQAEGYTMILERSEGGVVWVPGNLDLTDLVIQRYNAGEGRESGGGGGGGEGGGGEGGTKRSRSKRR
jgi:outer membrane protein